MAALVAAGLAASALVACSQHDAAPSDDITGAPWADGVEQFYEAWDAADQVGFTTAAVFFAQDAHQDFRYFNDFEGTGRAAIAQNYRDSMQIPPVFAGGFNQADASVGNALDEPFYISTDSAVGVSHSIGWQGISAASVERMSRAGIVDQTGLLTPSTAAQFFSTSAASYSTAGERFVAAWASGHADAVRALYADGATLVDKLAGIDVSGAAGVASLVGQPPQRGGLGAADLHMLPEGAGPAIYVNGSFFEPPDEVMLLLDVVPDRSCPGPVAVFFQLDQAGRISHEERFHRIDALRTCLPEDTRPSGWWDTVVLPSTPPIPRTGSMSGTTHEIALWNAEGGVGAIVAWARQRFADAGLPPPEPTSVTFLPDVPGDRWATYGFLTGSTAPDIGVPFTAPEACMDDLCWSWTPQARRATLHELAHLWFAPSHYSGHPQFVVRNRIDRWLAARGLTWWTEGMPRETQGAERVADIVAWGLMDKATTPPSPLDELSCADLTEAFVALTTTTPDPRACAESAGEVATAPFAGIAGRW